MQYIECASLPGGVGRVADGEHGSKLLDEGVALQLALVVFQALENETMVSGLQRRLCQDALKYLASSITDAE